MKSWFKPALAGVIIVLSVMISISTFQLPSPQPLTASDEVFSAARAMKHVQSIASQTHPVGSSELKEVQQYIIRELSAVGLEPEIQTGHGENDVKDFLGYVPYSGDLVNIYAKLEGSGTTRQTILMLAHYDTTLAGPGACDDSSSVAVLLETARVLSSDERLSNDVVFLFTDGEEANLLGSQAFVENTDLLKDVKLVLNFEGRGTTGPSILFETSDGNAGLMKEFYKAVAEPVAYSFTSDVYKMVTNVTDFTPFKHAGKDGFNFSNLGGGEVYHLPQDTPDNLDPAFLQHQGAYALSLARHFGNMPLDRVKSSDNAVYFTLVRSWMVLYSDQWNLPLTTLALALFLAAFWIGSRKRLLSVKGIISGFFISLILFVSATGFGIAAQTVFKTIYMKLDQLQSLDDLILLKRTILLEGNKWIVGSCIVTFILLIGLIWLLRRKAAGINLFFGGLIIWLILSVLSYFYLPGSGYMFLWPLIMSLAGLLIEFSSNSRIVPKYLVLLSFSALSCILIFIPVGYILFQALMMMGAGIPIAILSLPASLILVATSIFLRHSSVVSHASYHL